MVKYKEYSPLCHYLIYFQKHTWKILQGIFDLLCIYLYIVYLKCIIRYFENTSRHILPPYLFIWSFIKYVMLYIVVIYIQILVHMLICIYTYRTPQKATLIKKKKKSNIVIKRWNIYNILQNKTTCTTRSHSLYYFIQYIFKKHTWKILQGIFDLY